MTTDFRGLIAATLTPLHPNGRLLPEKIAPMVEQLIQDGVSGLYVCGSTGEGVSLTTTERKTATEEFIAAAAKRIPVLVQVGHNSLEEARQLAVHAAQCGADAISATCPNYFKVHSIGSLVDCMVGLSRGAPQLPFFYYHIPSLTGNQLDMPQFLERAADSIENLAGLKYTTPELHVYLQCQQVCDQRFQVFWGTDEMLMPAVVCGATAAIGSTYSIAAPLYRRMWSAVQHQNLELARILQMRAIEMIAVLLDFPFHAALKATMKFQGLDLGTCRQPLQQLDGNQEQQLELRLREIGFFDWAKSAVNS